MAFDFTSGRRNYSAQQTRIAPGSVVSECNFAQVEPNTPAIACDGELTLIECNLVNCALDPRWTVIDSNTAQMWYFEATQATPAAFDPAEVDRLRMLADLLTRDQWDKLAPEYMEEPSAEVTTTVVAVHPREIAGVCDVPIGAKRAGGQM